MDCATQCEYQYMVTWLQLRLTRNKHTATVTYHAGKSDIPRQLQFVDRSADYLRALVHFQLCDLRICQREAFGCVSICIKQYLKYFARSYELTERYAGVLERTIERNPAIWLWSHKRWRNPVTLPQKPLKDESGD